MVSGWKRERRVKVSEGILILVVVEFDFGRISRVFGRWFLGRSEERVKVCLLFLDFCFLVTHSSDPDLRGFSL